MNLVMRFAADHNDGPGTGAPLGAKSASIHAQTKRLQTRIAQYRETKYFASQLREYYPHDELAASQLLKRLKTRLSHFVKEDPTWSPLAKEVYDAMKAHLNHLEPSPDTSLVAKLCEDLNRFLDEKIVMTQQQINHSPELSQEAHRVLRKRYSWLVENLNQAYTLLEALERGPLTRPTLKLLMQMNVSLEHGKKNIYTHLPKFPLPQPLDTSVRMRSMLETIIAIGVEYLQQRGFTEETALLKDSSLKAALRRSQHSSETGPRAPAILLVLGGTHIRGAWARADGELIFADSLDTPYLALGTPALLNAITEMITDIEKVSTEIPLSIHIATPGIIHGGRYIELATNLALTEVDLATEIEVWAHSHFGRRISVALINDVAAEAEGESAHYLNLGTGLNMALKEAGQPAQSFELGQYALDNTTLEKRYQDLCEKKQWAALAGVLHMFLKDFFDKHPGSVLSVGGGVIHHHPELADLLLNDEDAHGRLRISQMPEEKRGILGLKKLLFSASAAAPGGQGRGSSEERSRLPRRSVTWSKERATWAGRKKMLNDLIHPWARFGGGMKDRHNDATFPGPRRSSGRRLSTDLPGHYVDRVYALDATKSQLIPYRLVRADQLTPPEMHAASVSLEKWKSTRTLKVMFPTKVRQFSDAFQYRLSGGHSQRRHDLLLRSTRLILSATGEIAGYIVFDPDAMIARPMEIAPTYRECGLGSELLAVVFHEYLESGKLDKLELTWVATDIKNILRDLGFQDAANSKTIRLDRETAQKLLDMQRSKVLERGGPAQHPAELARRAKEYADSWQRAIHEVHGSWSPFWAYTLTDIIQLETLLHLIQELQGPRQDEIKQAMKAFSQVLLSENDCQLFEEKHWKPTAVPVISLPPNSMLIRAFKGDAHPEDERKALEDLLLLAKLSPQRLPLLNQTLREIHTAFLELNQWDLRDRPLRLWKGSSEPVPAGFMHCFDNTYATDDRNFARNHGIAYLLTSVSPKQIKTSYRVINAVREELGVNPNPEPEFILAAGIYAAEEANGEDTTSPPGSKGSPSSASHAERAPIPGRVFVDPPRKMYGGDLEKIESAWAELIVYLIHQGHTVVMNSGVSEREETQILRLKNIVVTDLADIGSQARLRVLHSSKSKLSEELQLCEVLVTGNNALASRVKSSGIFTLLIESEHSPLDQFIQMHENHTLEWRATHERILDTIRGMRGFISVHSIAQKTGLHLNSIYKHGGLALVDEANLGLPAAEQARRYTDIKQAIRYQLQQGQWIASALELADTFGLSEAGVYNSGYTELRAEEVIRRRETSWESIHLLEISPRTYNALKKLGLWTMNAIAQWVEVPVRHGNGLSKTWVETKNALLAAKLHRAA